jgi:hypothetical protein
LVEERNRETGTPLFERYWSRPYKETHGHCNVSSRYMEDQALAMWAKMQRENFVDYGKDSGARKEV